MPSSPPPVSSGDGPSRHARSPATRYDVAAWCLTALALVLILRLHLLSALLGGLAVYESVHALAPRLTSRGTTRETGRLIAVALLAVVVVSGLVGAVIGLVAFLRSDQGNLALLLAGMADIIERSRELLPSWISDRLPENATELKSAVTGWLRTHAGDLTSIGAGAGRAIALVLVGMIVGGLAALQTARPSGRAAPLTRALAERARRFAGAFRRVVFAQVQISALNTVLTGLYLFVVLPLLGIQLPLVKTMLVVTFLTGLLPVVGNLISNTVIVTLSLSHSFGAAVGSLVFLVVIHKLEYFVNARIVGTEIRARAWEILIAMLVGEAAFGIPGVIAAPIYYAYLKNELAARGAI